MKVLNVFLFACCSVAWAQDRTSARPRRYPRSSDARHPGPNHHRRVRRWREAHHGRLQEDLRRAAAGHQPLALRNRQTFLQQWAFMRKLAQMAEKQKLDLESPAREQLDYSRLMILSQAELAGALNFDNCGTGGDRQVLRHR